MQLQKKEKPQPNFSDDCPLGFNRVDFKSQEEYDKAVEEMFQERVNVILKNLVGVENPGLSVGLNHCQKDILLTDGRDLKLYFFNVSRYPEISRNARLEITLMPTREDQFGFYANVSGGASFCDEKMEGLKLSTFRIYLGIPSDHTKWIHKSDEFGKEITSKELEQYARLLNLVIDELNNKSPDNLKIVVDQSNEINIQVKQIT